MKDLQTILDFKFPKVSDYLGEVKVTLSVINAGTQHNVVPEKCNFTLDVRVTDEYNNREVFEIIQSQMKSKLTPRSFRLNSSRIDISHPFVQAGIALGRTTYGSPTSSDQALSLIHIWHKKVLSRKKIKTQKIQIEHIKTLSNNY